MRRKRQQGVALVITLILLSVITFTAITFLIVSRREKGAVATSTDQTIAGLASDAGVARAQAEILSRIMAATNQFDYGLKVSTNYINSAGFVSGDGSLTNVSYVYADGNPLNIPADQETNIANLFYNPRVPVYVDTNDLNAVPAPPLDFRFYLDLNRNGMFDPNGMQPVVGQDGYYANTNGSPSSTRYDPLHPLPATTNFLSRFEVGDPEWIGVLQHPDEPHGPDNRFVARYATVVVPSGKTLDLNRVHNQAEATSGNERDYRRDMGVGTWEDNLAAFLVDLNTNIWTAPDDPLNPNPYIYEPSLNGKSVPVVQGVAFEDANSLVRYRYDTDFRQLRSVNTLFPGVGTIDFTRDLINGYGAEPLLTGIWLPTIDPDAGRTRFGWPGDSNPQHYFAPGDLFDVKKVSPQFVRRLRLENLPAGSSPYSTYNRYTFYRLLSQLGTDGSPEPSDKINLNYDNKVQQNAEGVASATNFYPWRPYDFFIRAADKMLREYQMNHFRRVFGADYVRSNNLALNIPVVTNGVFVYTPSINRLLQLAANIHDASTNSSGGGPVDFPSVFRPILGPPPSSDPYAPPGVYIVDWEEVTAANAASRWSLKPLDLFNPDDVAKLYKSNPGGVSPNVYGVPWIIGAKKGLPNFNELSIENRFEVTRKLLLRRPSATRPPNQTNQMFLISINSDAGVEAWNSYRTAFPEPVRVYATNQLDVMVYMTNRPSGTWTASGWHNHPVGNAAQVAKWTGTGWGPVPSGAPERQSFLAIIRTNFTVITNSIFRPDGQLITVLTPAFQGSVPNQFPVPDITIAFTNRLQFVMVYDGGGANNGRVLDYVQLRLGGRTNLTHIIAQGGDRENRRLWDTNRVGGGESISSPTLGIVRQILVSAGFASIGGADWRNYGFGQASGNTRLKAEQGFRNFLTGRGTNLVMQAPFSPSRRIRQYMSWQANDPLVHYTDGDLAQLDLGDGVMDLRLGYEPPTLRNIGVLNERYQPWGGNPLSSARQGRNNSPIFKDPLVRSSDDWHFPTNKFPNVGWLGRVHRGTPWQTIYMKAGEMPAARGRFGGADRAWREWTGNANRRDAALTFPQEDWKLFDLFTAAFNDNATVGQLSVNQDGLAAWSAVLSGVIALSNSTPDTVIQSNPGSYVITNDPVIIPPAGVEGANSMVGRIVAGINSDRSRAPNQAFQTSGDVLQAEELSIRSPFLNLSRIQQQDGITDMAYERIPQQIMGLLRGNDQPRFVIYSYGQALKPAPRSLVTSGLHFGMCTNYQITAETATRTVVRVEGAPQNPRVVVESYNVLPPD